MQVATSLTTHGRFLNSTITTITTILQSTSTTHYLNHPTKNLSTIDTKQTVQLTYSFLGIFLSLFCFITVVGNGLVIYAIVQERYLKSGRKSSLKFICLYETKLIRDVSKRMFPREEHESALNLSS